MCLAQIKRRPAFRSGHGLLLPVAAMIVSLGAVFPASAQMVNLSKPPVAAKPTEGDASWYDVPKNSRTKLRAGKDELTAAHNRLPYGTLVRVTHLGNGKSVTVRITDRLVARRRTTVIDLSKEAAAKLDMIRDGTARVRLEILPDDKLLPSKAKAPPW